MRYSRRSHRWCYSFVCTCLLFLFTACSSPSLSPGANQTPTKGAAATITPIPTTCPSATMPTKSKSIIMPAMQSGGDANIVYSISIVQPYPRSCSILRRYDVTTGKTVDIATINNGGISDAEISPDGQWILFSTVNIGCFEFDIIRMDGLYLQTLRGFCEADGNSQWSPNQHSVMLDVMGMAQRFDLLDMTTGKMQTELVQYIPYSTSYELHNWLDTKHVYVVDSFAGHPSIMPQYLYILDTRKGPDQQTSDLQFVTQLASPSAWSFDSSYDGSSLFISRCHCTADAQTGKYRSKGQAVSVRCQRPGAASRPFIAAPHLLSQMCERSTSIRCYSWFRIRAAIPARMDCGK